MDSSYSLAAKATCAQSLQRLKRSDPAPMAQWLRDHLFKHVMPFWETHAMDERGGILTCISDRGDVVSTEKWLWSQWRAVWVFSRIYNHLDSDLRWLNHARQIATFCLEHGWDDHGDGWSFLLSQRGEIRRGYESIYTDAFAVYGWCPHTEALYACLLAWRETGQPVFLHWYERLWRLCLHHFVDWQHGEWRQKLDRSFRPMESTVALPVKDPFHLPRSLILQIELLEGPAKQDHRSRWHKF